ncbi:DUF6292 family protein [Actinokineospora auranticolor]|uniref:DUF6292 domain-containing protein n=1 Tax=Actinokineospora auranticolor TaxID=155976 RepID=A0A2S6GJR1_9PSEU|nr:DUF6292 family protein [Actinokineospora auranticolor]PPK65457.1 hypothetical protein CLV40_114109 [Actinokineospora auranticolor]
MTAILEPSLGFQHPAHRALRAYLHAVAAELGIGPESTTVDDDTPVSGYLAVDLRLPSHPGRDVALLWDERHGWSAAVETHSGEDLIVVGYLGGDTVAPSPARVARFTNALQRGDRAAASTTPPAIRAAAGPEELAALFRTTLAAA